MTSLGLSYSFFLRCLNRGENDNRNYQHYRGNHERNQERACHGLKPAAQIGAEETGNAPGGKKQTIVGSLCCRTVVAKQGRRKQGEHGAVIPADQTGNNGQHRGGLSCREKQQHGNNLNE